MIARGDLGVELPPEDVPVLQKRLIALANARGKPVITATQMLESMVEHERPTRAEASDVANAVFDGTDAVMLSAETTVGRHPVTVVEMMARIVETAEGEIFLRRGEFPASHRISEPARAVTEGACHAADQLGAKAIVAFTQSGSTAALLSQHRPKSAIIAFACDAAICRRLNFYWGVRPYTMPWAESTDALITGMEERLVKEGLAVPGDMVVLVAGVPLEARPKANFFKVHRVGDSC
jgi:pyruvate kinase